MFKKVSNFFSSKNTGQGNSTPQEDKTKELYRLAQAELAGFSKTVGTATGELDFMPEESQPAAARLVDACKSELSKLEEEWNELYQQQTASEETLRAFIKNIKIFKEKLFLFELRQTHRRRLGAVEKQLAQHQSALTKEQLETVLRPHIDAQLAGIATLEKKGRLDVREQQILAIHQGNLKIFEEMLSGQRPYAPLGLINEIAQVEQAIRDIDNQIER
ncbi:MAG: hypothetical protein AB1801_02435 [Chloroflexota bacterium]